MARLRGHRGSEALVAVFSAARFAPLLLGPIAGAIADRYDRVRLLNLASAWGTLAVTILAVLAMLDALSYPALIVGGLAVGLAQSPSQPARAALVLELVGREKLSNANALNALAANTTQVIGPALGGVLIAAVGAPVALWIAAGWYLIALLLTLPLRHVPREHEERPEQPPSIMAMALGGLRVIGGNRLATALLLVTVAANVLVWPMYQSFMPVFAKVQFGLDADGLGLLLSACGVGGLVGSLVIAAFGDFRFKGAVFMVGTAGMTAAWIAFSLSRELPAGVTFIALYGLIGATFNVLQTTLLLLTTAPTVHGRVLGLQELAIGAIPVSVVFLGLIADRIGAPLTATVAGSVFLVCLVVAALVVPQLLTIGRDQEDPPPSADEAVR